MLRAVDEEDNAEKSGLRRGHESSVNLTSPRHSIVREVRKVRPQRHRSARPSRVRTGVQHYSHRCHESGTACSACDCCRRNLDIHAARVGSEMRQVPRFGIEPGPARVEPRSLPQCPRARYHVPNSSPDTAVCTETQAAASILLWRNANTPGTCVETCIPTAWNPVGKETNRLSQRNVYTL